MNEFKYISFREQVASTFSVVPSQVVDIIAKTFSITGVMLFLLLYFPVHFYCQNTLETNFDDIPLNKNRNKTAYILLNILTDPRKLSNNLED